jgi:hypothetical protein
MTALARASSNCKRKTLSSEWMLYKEYGRKDSVENISLAVSLKRLGAKTNCLAVNHQALTRFLF